MAPVLVMSPPAPFLDLRTPEGRQDLVRRHADALYRWAWTRTGGDAEAAEETVQRAFLSAFERPGTYDPSRGEPWGWLMGLALNALKALRRSRRGTGFVEEPEAEAPHPMEAEEERLRIRMALTSLPPWMQTLLREHCIEGKPLGDGDLAPSTAWDRLQEAQSAFRKAARRMGVEA